MGFEANWRSVLLRLVAVTVFGCVMTVAMPERASAQCVGDCDGMGSVTVDEIVTMVNIALGTGNIDACNAGDSDGSGTITVDEIISATNNALNGCPMVAVCGNGIAGPGEDCDDGGICIGGANAGTACSGEEDCQGNGICEGGIRVGTMCASDDDCPSSRCIHCKPFGGDGCAANCTTEKTIAFDLVPGVTDGFDIALGTSGVVVFSAFLTIPLELQGSLTLTVGEERDGQIPAVVKTVDVHFPAIPVVSFACACVKGAIPKTCGGVGFLEDGTTLSPDCTDDEEECMRRGLPPCTVIHGDGNTASGTIGCESLEGVDLTATLADGDLSVTLGGNGGPGSALIFTSIDIGIVVGPCSGSGADYGPDGMFCTDDDPPNELSATGTGPTTTGEACGEIVSETDPLGPVCRSGIPMSCAAIGGDPGSLSGSCLTFALPVAGLPDPVGDIVATLSLCAQ
jgi:hypothetical protein